MKMNPAQMEPKAKRMSVVALTAAVFALLWALVDWALGDNYFPPVVVSAVTSLGMLVAGFYDFKHEDDGDTYRPGGD